jgi:hypothetical protein
MYESYLQIRADEIRAEMIRDAMNWGLAREARAARSARARSARRAGAARARSAPTAQPADSLLGRIRQG